MPPTPGPKTQAERDRDAKLAPYATAVKAGKSLLTRRIHQAEKKVQAYVNAPASYGANQEMANARELVREAAKRVEDAYTKISTVDQPEQFDEYMKRLDAEVDRADTMADAITELIIAREMELRQQEETGSTGAPATSPTDPNPRGVKLPGAPPEKTTQARKPNDALKPFCLTSAHTPVELEEWFGRFRAYHSTSRMDLCSAVDQQAYLRSCLDPALYNRIKDKMDSKMPLFVSQGSPQPNCFALLEAEFNSNFPVVTRRVQFFRQDQKPGELFSDWARSVQESAAQCQFGAITADDIIVLRLLTGVADKKLALDLYKLKDPNLQQLKDTASAYEVAKRTFAAVATPKESKTFHTTTGQGGPTGNKSKGKSSKGAQAHAVQVKNFKCYRCGDTNKEHSCKATSATCKYCGKTGHFASVCNKKKSDGKSGSSKSAQGKRPPKAQQATADESDSDTPSAHAGTTE